MTSRTLAALLALWLAASPASAQPTDSTDARYEAALVDLDEGRFKEACPKLEAVIAAAPDRLIAHYKLGGCYLALGKLASAWSRFVFVRERAKEAKSFQQARVAGDSARRIEKKLAKLSVVVPAEVAQTPGLAVRCDGAVIEPAELGQARPVDKGSHRIEATAPGRAAWATTVLVDADGKSFSVTLEPLAREVVAPPPSPASDRAWQRPLSLAVAGVGLAGVATGGVAFALALQKKEESQHDCRPDDHCNATGFAARNDARMMGDVSTAALIAGGVVLSAGVVLFVTAPRRETSPRPAGTGAVRAQLTLGLGHLGVTGSW